MDSAFGVSISGARKHKFFFFQEFVLADDLLRVEEASGFDELKKRALSGWHAVIYSTCVGAPVQHNIKSILNIFLDFG